MEIEVRAEAEDIVTGIKTITGTAFVTFVALDKNGKPTHVPKLLLKTEKDQTKFAEGKIRMEERLRHRKKSNI
jgi:acyl-CoA hydrolase